MMKRTHALLLAASLLAACQPKESGVARLETEVMALHDRVMPRTDELIDLKSQVSARLNALDSLAKTGQLPPDREARRREGLAVSLALTEADNAMSDWMNQYNADSLKTLDEAGAEAYLLGEKKKIEAVQKQYDTSIERAKKYLQTTP